ncbi:hypothetical protein [Paraflavitalea sp. CAU 1676]|uniref:hypothetical protein n=1 Tax=Paraflavitalea sp. CAU 1676 TaxID=3032598 RepID=UPI0023DB9098|nr:hypothetical protein [Paraflavitalea sp. CAU 1676]MDF2190523.1 hypothetical protein [Paraflavitalea sp. CAU 1676]
MKYALEILLYVSLISCNNLNTKFETTTKLQSINNKIKQDENYSAMDRAIIMSMALRGQCTNKIKIYAGYDTLTRDSSVVLILKALYPHNIFENNYDSVRNRFATLSRYINYFVLNDTSIKHRQVYYILKDFNEKSFNKQFTVTLPPPGKYGYVDSTEEKMQAFLALLGKGTAEVLSNNIEFTQNTSYSSNINLPLFFSDVTRGLARAGYINFMHKDKICDTLSFTYKNSDENGHLVVTKLIYPRNHQDFTSLRDVIDQEVLYSTSVPPAMMKNE